MFLTTFTHSEGVRLCTAIPCFGDDEFLKPGIKLYIYHCREKNQQAIQGKNIRQKDHAFFPQCSFFSHHYDFIIEMGLRSHDTFSFEKPL